METFKNSVIEVMGSTHLKGKAPASWEASDWKKFHTTFTRQQTTPYKLAAAIWQGYSFTPVFDGRRKEENFVAAWHMAFDFDAEGASLDYLMRDGSIAWLFASFAYSTPSSTAEHPKSRVVFIFDDPITTAEKSRELYRAIAWQFEQDGSKTDPQCKDPLRLYYGSPGCQVIGNWSVLTTVSYDPERPSMADWFIAEYEKAHPPKPPSSIKPTTKTIKADDQYIESRIVSLLEGIIRAPDGKKHGVLNRNAFVLGGFVASGYLSQMEAAARLEDAIIANGRAKDFAAALRTIETAVRDGMEQPIVIEARIKNYGIDTL